MESNCISDGLEETKDTWTNKKTAKHVKALHILADCSIRNYRFTSTVWWLAIDKKTLFDRE